MYISIHILYLFKYMCMYAHTHLYVSPDTHLFQAILNIMEEVERKTLANKY